MSNNEFGSLDLKGGRKVRPEEFDNTREAIWFPNSHKSDLAPARTGCAITPIVAGLLAFAVLMTLLSVLILTTGGGR